MADQSYIGKGRLFMGPYDGSAAAVEVGNVSKLEFSVSEEKKDLLDYTSAGGGKRNSLSRITAVSASLSIHDFTPENLARAMFGDVDAVTAAAVADEVHTAYKTGLIRFAYLPNLAETIAVKHTSGTPTYVAGTDYEVVNAGVVILTAGVIADAQSLKISYTKKAGNVVEALVNSAQEFKFYFVGLNEAQSGKQVAIDIHRFKPGPLQNWGVIGDDFATLEVTGEVLSDSAITGTGLSKYFKVEQAS